MKQIKVFNGTINGEKFDNVQAYNTRMTELINAGATNIEASSSTSIKFVEDESMEMTTGIGTDTPICACDEIDEDLTIYPYFEADDPKYLDILVTADPATNAEAYKETNTLLDKCFLYITDNLYDKDLPYGCKKNYLERVEEIIASIKNDNINTTNALKSVDSTRARAASEFRAAQVAFDAAQVKYNNTIKECDAHQSILQAAKPIIAMMLEFYHSVQQETLQALVEDRTEHCCTCNDTDCETCSTCGKCKCECTCDAEEPNVKCNVREVSPQQLSDVSDWFNNVLRACGLDMH